jgi:small GTP-binding protein
LSENPIEELPLWITDFNMEFKWVGFANDGFISLRDNPLKSPPIEIVKQGKVAVINYFKSLEGSRTVKLNEVKVLLVGEGMAGKTSLLKQLQGLEFDKDESQTHGVNVVSLNVDELHKFGKVEGLADCRLHCWDFGGQEIMHASHQFFLSKRSLYVLVLDSRTDSKKYHWLRHIEKFGGDSPVMVVMNKIDDNPSYNIEQKRINDDFPQVKKRFYRISCKTGDGVPALVESLPEAIAETSLFGTDISVDWMNIKDRVVEETNKHQYISREQFVEICNDHNVTDESMQLTLLRFLHDLGIVLYFEQLKLNNSNNVLCTLMC